MNIAIIGYGKMGKAIEKIAKIRNHQISFFSNKSPCNISFKNTDVAVEFSRPDSAFKNIKICIENKIPIVCGTTGWLDKFNLVKDICKKKNGTFLYSSNFSIGMNIFYEINHKLSKLLFPYSINYEIKIEEIHHKKKIDRPSGTALFLAKNIINNKMKKTWVLDKKKTKDEILIVSKRFDKVPGIHRVLYQSKIENIEIEHKAHNREGFAIGAIIAAEWIQNKKGIFSMKEVLGI
ncbi:4-hydroxy-tetrahydrodipicolinate reductase [Blattabacterium sp. (Cryptocercus kyebangensis)]|uniref:4-hydroxy-tetrahydrodipicolinate reductase n=1 Tax=Blattabacterium sp. (Cryptocercus kyebangensis) TaxID=298656 RepID=UPI000D7CCFA5|nr:4-hydroxy-tetrahydrodipicolinate reductase [Blattabacterium sp. (Cryptocercus kyebangensis)]AWU43923.1 4-hydroxy-tetrahydrodipicolinate reductase [Blattabacterium sp. (Cryptocercus kyebangensis)]